MRRYLWTIILTIGVLFLASCGSEEDDKLAGFPWNDQELFSQVFTMDDNGRCLLEGQDAMSRQALNIYLVGYGWQPVGIYQVMENGKLSKDDYREKIEGYVPKVYEFLTNEQMKTYYSEDDTNEKCFKKQIWTYNDKLGIITRKDKRNHDEMDKYLQVLEVKTSEDATYLYAVEKIGTEPVGENLVKNIFGLVVYQRLSNSEMSSVKNTYTTDKSVKDDMENIPNDCHFYIRCSYANPSGYIEKSEHSKFQSFRLLKMELTNEKGINSSSNPYYQYFDSIVWTCKGMPDRVVSLRNNSHGKEVSYSVNSYFFRLDETKNTGVTTSTTLTIIQADGYKGGRVVYTSGTGINIMNSAFLGYSFSADELQHPSKDDNFDLYCVFDQSLRYRLLSPRYSEEFPGNPYSELRYIVNDVPKDDAEEDNDTKYEYILGKEKQELSDLMDMYYPQSVNGGKGIVVDETNIKKYRARFKALPSDANIITYWNALTSSMQSGYGGCKVALVLKRDQESPQKSYYYIHAEPKN